MPKDSFSLISPERVTKTPEAEPGTPALPQAPAVLDIAQWLLLPLSHCRAPCLGPDAVPCSLPSLAPSWRTPSRALLRVSSGQHLCKKPSPRPSVLLRPCPSADQMIFLLIKLCPFTGIQEASGCLGRLMLLVLASAIPWSLINLFMGTGDSWLDLAGSLSKSLIQTNSLSFQGAKARFLLFQSHPAASPCSAAST